MRSVNFVGGLRGQRNSRELHPHHTCLRTSVRAGASISLKSPCITVLTRRVSLAAPGASFLSSDMSENENDVEMREVAAHVDAPAPTPPASPSASSKPHSSHSVHSPSSQTKNEDEDDVIVVQGLSKIHGEHPRSRSASAQAPPTDNQVISIPAAQPEASTSTNPPPSHPKPKSTKQRKSRSPSPFVPPPPPPLLTVRLDIALGGPENYEVDVSQLALKAGQRNPTPPPIRRDTSDSEGDDSDDAKTKTKGKDKTGKRSRATEYDLNDPFIDDSELAIDDRTHFAQTKQQGFYVSSGEVALLKDKSSPKKPKSKRPLILSSAAAANIQPLAQPSAPSSLAAPAHPRTPLHAVIGPQEGTRESPIALLDDDDQKPLEHGQKRKLSTGPSVAPTSHDDSPKKRRKMQSLQPFHPDLEASLETLKDAIAKESFEIKGKFPPALKPKLQQLALQAIVLDEYNDNFFARMPQLFPYNKFTMTKLIKRLVYAEHHALLVAQQDELLIELKDLADKGLDQAKAEWERNVQNWEERKERWDADLKAAGHAKPGSAAASVEPSAQDDGDDESPAPDGEGAANAIKEGKGYQQKKPPKKYRLTEQMKAIFWQLYCLSNDCSRLTNEKNQLENVPETVSEQGMRKILYQKIINAFPPGWMTSSNISRDISVIKKKQEAEQSRFDETNSQ